MTADRRETGAPPDPLRCVCGRGALAHSVKPGADPAYPEGYCLGFVPSSAAVPVAGTPMDEERKRYAIEHDHVDGFSCSVCTAELKRIRAVAGSASPLDPDEREEIEAAIKRFGSLRNLARFGLTAPTPTVHVERAPIAGSASFSDAPDSGFAEVLANCTTIESAKDAWVRFGAPAFRRAVSERDNAETQAAEWQRAANEEEQRAIAAERSRDEARAERDQRDQQIHMLKVSLAEARAERDRLAAEVERRASEWDGCIAPFRSDTHPDCPPTCYVRLVWREAEARKALRGLIDAVEYQASCTKPSGAALRAAVGLARGALKEKP